MPESNNDELLLLRKRVDELEGRCDELITVVADVLAGQIEMAQGLSASSEPDVSRRGNAAWAEIREAVNHLGAITGEDENNG